ncbi:MAG: multiheme c-type cytochrome [bacterium]
MSNDGLLRVLFSFLPIALGSLPAFPDSSPSALPAAQAYVVLGWNDLGMHCMNQRYENLCILPPFNNLWAQVIQRGSHPRLVDQNVTVTYRFPKNTVSHTKVNFWDYANRLFNVTLQPDVGLTGNGLAGAMTWNSQAFEATGVPLTPFDDDNPAVEHPYQVAVLTLMDAQSGEKWDESEIVAPVSVEMHCDQCHREDGMTPEEVILEEHDEVNGQSLTALKPVLCASCHESNALGTSKKPGIPSLSLAVHGKHAREAQEEGLNIECYDCHPGRATQCFRDVMFSAGHRCEDCHGTLAQVASSIQQQNRRPWLDEPKCDDCHAAQYAVNPGKLYRQSTGHGGLFCEACHNSPHAIWPTIQPADNAQAIRVQGFAGAISDCRVCHVTLPEGPGPHGLRAGDVAPVKAWGIY